MEQLSYGCLKKKGYQGYLKKEAPERVLQFGEGNFLRAFVDYFIDVLNEKTDFDGKVVIVQPIPQKKEGGMTERFEKQEGLYTLYLRGMQEGKQVAEKRIISCVNRCINAYNDFEELMKCAENPDLRFIVSNTTEAGISCNPEDRFEDKPAGSFPGKLTQFLYRRFKTMGEEQAKGFVLLPCELIDDNGKELERCVLQYAEWWGLEESFKCWVKEKNSFCSTLVDRIVTGYPAKEIQTLQEEHGYVDELIDTGEIFGFWVIEGEGKLEEELPFAKAGLPVLFTDDQRPYKQRKVRILNGAHTSFVPGAYLAGQNIVRECMQDKVIRGFMNKTIQEEIIPTMTLPKEELTAFAEAVADRFQNPYIDHALLSICLNSTSKWKVRVLPSLKGYVAQKGQLPMCLTASFAFYLCFYRGVRRETDALIGERNGEEYQISDESTVLAFFEQHAGDTATELVHAVCGKEEFWGESLLEIPNFESTVSELVERVWTEGAYQVMASVQ